MRSSKQSPYAGFVIVLFLAAFLAVDLIWIVIPDIVYARMGSPPIEQLHRVEGRVTSWRDCSAYTKKHPRLDERVTLLGASGSVAVVIPCVLPAGSLSDGQQHRMVILSRSRLNHADVVYDVTLDDHTLLAYADVKAREDDAMHVLGQNAVLILVPLVMLVSLTTMSVRRSRRPG